MFKKLLRVIKKIIFGWYIKKYANCITVNTNYLKNDVLSNYKLDKEKIHVIYNCIDTQNLITKQQNIDTNNFVIGTIGRIVEAKRIDRLLEAFSIFKQKYPQQYLKSQLLIIGGGVLSSKLKLKAKQLGIIDSVNFTGFVDDINTYRSKIDLFVLSSGIMDSFPLTFLEAMYCKIPVVCFTDSGGVPEVIKDKVNGFIVENEEGLANCFNDFIEMTPAIKDKIVKNAYIMLQKDFTIASYTNKYKALYHQVI